ncbi:MAG TPA: PAS domain S-box protein, partial [Thermoanaerobaculia bacterium]|nr:PAS domain S-box protein [Thermoanaerobaculia bacterium]
MEESRFRSLAESERFGVVVADFAGNLLDFNDAFLRLAGYGREELRRGTVGWRELTPPEYWRRDEMAIEEMRRTGACSPYEKELVNPDGRRVPVLLTGSLVDEKAGTCVDIVVDLSGRKRAESALQESRERLQFALDAARMVAWDWDVETGRMHWSANAQDVLGLPPEPTLETALAMVHPDDRARVDRLVERALQGEVEYAAEYRLVRPSGVIWVYDRGAVIRNIQGRPVRMTGVCQDVTERRRAEEENSLLLARERAARARAEAAEQRAAFLAEAGEVLASSLDDRTTLRTLARLAVPRVADYCVLLEVGAGNRITPVAFEHVDPGKETFLERVGELYRVRSDDPRSLVGAILGTGRSEIVGYPTLVEWEQEIPEDPELREIFGELHPVSGMLLPLVVRGEVVGILVLALSESGRRFDDADLELGVELARRAALAIDNARLYQEARAANTAKDRFLATLSHELRTPLAPVLASVSALEKEERIEPRLRDVLSMVRRNVELEARLIDDLLDVTRAVHGKMTLSRDVCDLHRVLGQALETCCSPVLRSQRQVSTRLGAERHKLRGDARRLTQIFLNLLQNAIKFTPPGGSITVRSLNEDALDGSWLVVEVEDSGMGIEPDLLPRMFEP